MNKEKEYLIPIGDLAEGRYLRGSMLVDAGLKSFLPALRFQEEFAESEDQLVEFRQFCIRRSKFDLGADEEFPRWFDRQREEAAKKYAETGNIWDNDVTSFRQHYKKVSILEGQRLTRLAQPYKDEISSLWRDEVSKFSSGFVDALVTEKKKLPSRTSLYHRIMGNGLLEWGFERDPEESTTRELAYSRFLSKEYKLSVKVDLIGLRQSVGLPFAVENSGEVIQAPGPRFVVWLELHKIVRGGERSKRVVGISFDSLFPIREFPLGINCYSKFYELEELEALINIYLTLYKMLKPELDDALMRAV